MPTPDVILNNFSEIDIFSIAKHPIIAIYKHPADYPSSFVARLWDLTRPTMYIVLRDNINDIRQTIPPVFDRLLPTKQDDPVIYETWI